MKKVLAIALALSMVLTLGISAMASEGKITLRFTNFYTEEDVANNADARARDVTMKKYAQDNADTLDIVFTALSHTDYATKIQAQAAADDMEGRAQQDLRRAGQLSKAGRRRCVLVQLSKQSVYHLFFHCGPDRAGVFVRQHAQLPPGAFEAIAPDTVLFSGHHFGGGDRVYLVDDL